MIADKSINIFFNVVCMVDSIINCDDPSKAQVVLLAANYDKTSSFRKGSFLGPKAIKDCLDTQIEFYEPYTGTVPRDLCKILYDGIGGLSSLRPEKMIRKLATEFKQHYTTGKFIITLGGEHSVSIAPFQVIADQHSDEITVLQIDAHADLRDDDSDYSDKPFGKYAHCCVMRRAHELGLKTVQVGIRAYSKDEQEFMSANDLTVFKWNQEKLPSIEEIIESVGTADGIDPAYMPATGTPVQGGLEWRYAMSLMRQLAQKKDIIAADIVEVAPRNADVLTEYGAAQMCYNLIAFKMIKGKR